jgi:hypothetical protein
MTSVATSGSRRGSEPHKAAEVGEHNKVAAQYLLGVVFLRCGEVNDAVREWEAAAKISYHDRDWYDFYSNLEMGFEFGTYERDQLAVGDCI